MTIYPSHMALVSDLMTSPVITANMGTTLAEAISLLKAHRIRHLPVVNARGVLVGVISNRNMMVAHLSKGDASGTRRVGHLMSSPPLSIRPNDLLAVAADRLLRHKIGCLPVVDEAGLVIGIIAESDFVKAFSTHRDMAVNEATMA